MAIDPITAAALSAASKGAIDAVARPVLTGGLSGLKSLSEAVIDIFVNRFADYVQEQVERHSFLNTIVFGNQKALHDLYVPLTVVPVSQRDGESETGMVLLDRFQKSFLPKHKRVLITDTAGMGKSTLLKFLFLQCIKSHYALPVFIELRHLSQTQSILDIIERQLNPTTVAETDHYFTRQRIERILKKGGLVFFFDGYDEIAFKDREKVTEDIKRFVDRFSSNLFAITSRPESGLLAFPTFKQFSIRPLLKKESFELIKKYDQNGVRSQQLIEKLEGRDFVAVQEFLKNPLLTTLLYRSFEYKQNLPLKKHVFYRQVFDALFDWHDSTKDGYNTREKKSKLDIDSFHRILRVMGFISVMTGQVEGDTDTVLGWIRKAKGICLGTVFHESDFLDDLIRAVPIFVKDGSYFRWSHKSLAEYFAAQYICTEGKLQQEQILSGLMKSGRLDGFANVLDQIYDIDNHAFRKYLIIPMARSFSEYWQSSYKGLDPKVSAEVIRLRKCCGFGSKYFVGPGDLLHRSVFDSENHMKELLGSERKAGHIAPHIYFVEPHTRSTDANLIIVIPGPYVVILDILDTKRDPLIQQKSKIDLSRYDSKAKISTDNKFQQITDDIGSKLNTVATFAAVTRLMVRAAPAVVDAEKLLEFEESFNNALTLSTLTDNLLDALKERPTK